MSTFEVKIVQVKAIEPIADADAIELAVVGDYRSVVRKGDYAVGALAAYIPEASVIPDDLLEMMGLTGKLAGKQHNRVKAVRLRGCLSQGILLQAHCVNPFAHGGVGRYEIDLPNRQSIVVSLGDNVAEQLGITKYNPPIPTCMDGEVYNAGMDITYNYDIENFKWYPDVLVDGEQVQFTEKLHGTFCQLIYLPLSILEPDEIDTHIRITGDTYDCCFAIASKGMGSEGLCFVWGDPNESNVYQRAVYNHLPTIASVLDPLNFDHPVMIMGEVFGAGIQDLHYGMKNEFSYRIFDVYVGYRGQGNFVDDEALDKICDLFGVPRVPVVYRGPFSKEIMLQYTNYCKSELDQGQMREGIVIKPVIERRDASLGRVVLKSINEEYLLRKNKNATEYQ